MTVYLEQTGPHGFIGEILGFRATFPSKRSIACNDFAKASLYKCKRVGYIIAVAMEFC